jgi:diguanylate cyclase (GGDEF)-like protein
MQTLNVLDNRFSPFKTYSTLSSDALIAETFSKNIFDKRKKLAFMTQLQTTLNIDELLSIFAAEASEYIEFSGLYLESQKLNKSLRGSRKAKKECRFDLKLGNGLIGTLSYGIDSPISLECHKVLEQLHQCLLHPLKNSLAYHCAIELAMQDALTGLGNRRYFDEQLKRAMHNAKRQHSSVGLVLGDLNKFKIINDTYGHGTGDLVLQEFAKILQQCIRNSDSLFRFGGDEFAIIVENATETALSVIEKRITKALMNNALLSEYKLGCSIGATFMNRSDNRASFFKRADETLYRRKKHANSHLTVV